MEKKKKKVIDFLKHIFIFLVKVILNFFLKWSINNALKTPINQTQLKIMRLL